MVGIAVEMVEVLGTGVTKSVVAGVTTAVVTATVVGNTVGIVVVVGAPVSEVAIQ